MTWSNGEKITASVLNNFNKQKYVGFSTVDRNATHIRNFIYHGSSGLFYRYTVENKFGTNSWMCVDKLIDGKWVECYAKQDLVPWHQWGDNVYIQKIKNPGPGQWRIRFISNLSRTSDWGIYPYQQDCQSGEPLTIWPQYDGAYSSESVSKGSSLSTSILDTGRVGTYRAPIGKIVNTSLFSSSGIPGTVDTYDVDGVVDSSTCTGCAEDEDTFSAVGKDSNGFYLLKTDASRFSSSDTAYKYYQYDSYTWEASESMPNSYGNDRATFEHTFNANDEVLLDTSCIPSGWSGIIYSIWKSEINKIPGVLYA